jgi:hypothetical protein
MANSPNKFGSLGGLRCPPRLVSIRNPRAGSVTSGQTFARSCHVAHHTVDLLRAWHAARAEYASPFGVA